MDKVFNFNIGRFMGGFPKYLECKIIKALNLEQNSIWFQFIIISFLIIIKRFPSSAWLRGIPYYPRTEAMLENQHFEEDSEQKTLIEPVTSRKRLKIYDTNKGVVLCKGKKIFGVGDKPFKLQSEHLKNQRRWKIFLLWLNDAFFLFFLWRFPLNKGKNNNRGFQELEGSH